MTSIIEGKTILSNHYTTITYSATATGNAKGTSHSGLSKKNRNIVIGCVVGIGLPLIIMILVLIYMFCIRSKKTDFIDSNGNVVTAYRTNKVSKLWHSVIGKNNNDEEYESYVPLGGLTDEDDLNNPNDDISSSSGPIDIRNLKENNHSTSPSNEKSPPNDPLVEDEIFYDEHGNELNAKMY